MFDMGDANAAEEVVWCGRWAKGAEAVTVKITLQGNKIRFRESDVQQSLHAAMRRKHLPEDLIDAKLPNSDSATGPWQQTDDGSGCSRGVVNRRVDDRLLLR